MWGHEGGMLSQSSARTSGASALLQKKEA